MVTLGPSTNTGETLRKLEVQGVDFVRINMSHSELDDLRKIIGLSKKVQIPFVVDTEGSQIRTNNNKEEIVCYNESDEVLIHNQPILGDNQNLSLRPLGIVELLEPGDLIYVDFHSVVINVMKRMDEKSGTAKGIIISSGKIGSNKGVFIDSFFKKDLNPPVLTEKDIQSIQIGLEEGIHYIAASFMRSGQNVHDVKKAVKGKMKVISKIECMDALNNLDEIIEESDYLLIDRGDLSKEVPLEQIPLLQKIILNKAKEKGKGVFVATNLLESMIVNKVPTRAEVYDVMGTIADGAYGLILSAETAIGDNPFICVNMMNRFINHSTEIYDKIGITSETLSPKISKYYNKYYGDRSNHPLLIKPHGDHLVNRIQLDRSKIDHDLNIPVIPINNNALMDLEQISVGAYSPLEGFMNQNDLNAVLDDYQLTNGIFWSLPILLDIEEQHAEKLILGKDALLSNSKGFIVGKITVSDIYSVDKKDLCRRLFGTNNPDLAGVQLIESLKPVFIGGKVTLFNRIRNEINPYNLSPLQVRRLFNEKNWQTIVGFHTRNVTHRAHEYIQMKAMEMVMADGLFIHPVIGRKKPGDYNSKYIIQTYEYMMKHIYPKYRMIFATFPTYSRYGGIREAVFTAICRQNYGCSHFIMGRDHTGSDSLDVNSRKEKTLQDMMSEFEIEIIQFDNVHFSKSRKIYTVINDESDQYESISGSQCRELLEAGIKPPDWYMRGDISDLILRGIKTEDDVFVKHE